MRAFLAELIRVTKMLTKKTKNMRAEMIPWTFLVSLFAAPNPYPADSSVLITYRRHYLRRHLRSSVNAETEEGWNSGWFSVSYISAFPESIIQESKIPVHNHGPYSKICTKSSKITFG